MTELMLKTTLHELNASMLENLRNFFMGDAIVHIRISNIPDEFTTGGNMTEQEQCQEDQQKRYQDVVQKLGELLDEYILCDPPYQYDADSEMINFIVFLRKKTIK